MTETQKKLMPYVEAKVKTISEYKEANNISPVLVMEPEIITDIRSDVLECRSELHRSGKYRSTQTLNVPALIKNH